MLKFKVFVASVPRLLKLIVEAVDAIDINNNATCSRRRQRKKCDGRRPISTNASNISPFNLISTPPVDEIFRKGSEILNF